MKSVRFVLHRHPLDPTGGGTCQIARLMMEVAAESAQVSATVLSSLDQIPSPWPIDCVAKPPLRPVRVGLGSLKSRRSLMHTRFRIADLTAQLRTAGEDVLAAVHTYMAESALDALGPESAERLAVNLDVSESDLLLAGEGHRNLRRLEAARTRRDEVRCLSSARYLAGFDQGEMALYAEQGVGSLHLLRPTFPPRGRPSTEVGRNLLFLGDRTWKPNYAALERMLAMWAHIVARSPRSQLLVVGRGPLPASATQAGVKALGYLDSLDAVWRDTRALVAPIGIGGGVRVKILEAAANGVPVVASPEGVGSIDRYLPITPSHSDAQFVDECVELLNDPVYAQGQSETLFSANEEWWTSGEFQTDVSTWLELSSS
jgi:polysaccharide biosynthesis protein PslH